MIPEFFTQRPDWPGRIERIVESLGRVSALEELSSSVPELRRSNRIGSVHSSTAIEGNRLSLAEVEGVANGEAVFAPPRDVKEVENALAAYNEIEKFDPWNVDDFLRAHRMLTEGLIRESGAFRTVDVDIVGPAGRSFTPDPTPRRCPASSPSSWSGARRATSIRSSSQVLCTFSSSTFTRFAMETVASGDSGRRSS